MAASPAAHEAELVEREREVGALDSLLAAATAGEGRVALIEGPAGIGKSRLLALARRRAGETLGTAPRSANPRSSVHSHPYSQQGPKQP